MEYYPNNSDLQFIVTTITLHLVKICFKTYFLIYLEGKADTPGSYENIPSIILFVYSPRSKECIEDPDLQPRAIIRSVCPQRGEGSFSQYRRDVFLTLHIIYIYTYLIAAREKFHILKNGSDYQGAWPPLLYIKINDTVTHVRLIY